MSTSTIATPSYQEPTLLAKILRRRETGAVGILLVLAASICAFHPGFLNYDNLFIVSRQISMTAIVALGVFFVILTSGIDLSVGSIVGFSGYVCGLAFKAGWPAPMAAGAGLLVGMTVGAVNGTIVAYLRVTPFIVTLAMLWIARTGVLVSGKGDSVRGIPQNFSNLMGKGSFLGVPAPVIILLIVALLAHLTLTFTPFGRRIYALGGNEEATELSGINTKRVKFFTYVTCGLFCGIAGLVYIARSGTASADLGDGMELYAIAACVIGGTSLMGGQGTVLGVVLGAAIMGVLNNGLVLLEVSSYWEKGIIGSIIVIAAIVDVLRTRRGV
jgi:ribose transport system permease protein